eukprot:CAMPEP_0198112500 /NCGR_PEP_ID=MMETSP1442-20131203/4344_1 /TAXON_ID= /ORGANISM="Craspedostauros australis, Strain CCMP3328" /LENGTH=347 /DNA_ID=CAMNT_0043769295 /DNA_START=32 /DNA_END=1075 /DNA_ORIENTATION=+
MAALEPSSLPLSPQLPVEVPEDLKHITELLDVAKKRRISLIFSEEQVSSRPLFRSEGLYGNPMYFQNLRDLLEGWDVTVIVTYRHVFDWMLSAWKYSRAYTTVHYRPYSAWPTQRGKRYSPAWKKIWGWMTESSAPIQNHLQNTSTGTHTMTVAASFVFIDGVISAWRNSGFPIQIMDFHGKRHVSEQFLCDHVPDAPRSCEYIKQKHENPPQMVIDMLTSVCQDIVFAAAARGVISEEKQRTTKKRTLNRWLRQHLGEVLNKKLADFPLICPPDNELEELLNMSLAIEKEWMPERRVSPDGEAAHRSAFHRTAYVKREYCEVDMGRLFEGVTTWDGLLEALNKTWS